jgi:uncharacterized protein YcbX
MEETLVGRVSQIWRYPVKSMFGEEVEATEVMKRGVLGDRGYALFAPELGKVASAKDPRRWPNLFAFQARYIGTPEENASLPPVEVTLPSGKLVTSDDADVEQRISAEVGRTVRLLRVPFHEASAEGYWPDQEWIAERNTSFAYQLPEGTFFDGASVHLVTTATLAFLASRYPDSRFEVPRFRANLLIETRGDEHGFVENRWIGKTLMIGSVRLHIERPCPRCVMTTLPQSNLPRDMDVLRAAVKENSGNVGVYAKVEVQGRVTKGDAIFLE